MTSILKRTWHTPLSRNKRFRLDYGLTPARHELLKRSRNRRKADGAGNEIRTRDTKLGKLVLYQLSYARFASIVYRKELLR